MSGAETFCAVCEGADPYDPPHSVCVCGPDVRLTPEALAAIDRAIERGVVVECPDSEWLESASAANDPLNLEGKHDDEQDGGA